jgi:Ca2+-binding EF-hand superfamily protein
VKKLGIDKSDPKIVEIKKQLGRTLKEQGSSLRSIFSDFDSDGDGMLNFGEFSKGIRSIMSVN